MDSNKFLIEKLGKGGLVDEMKRYNLYSIFREMGFKVGCEVGVASGRNAVRIVKRISGVKLYLVDSYFYTKEHYKFSLEHPALKHLKKAEGKFKRLHRKYDFEVKFIGKESSDAVRDFEDESLDFVYIDANHDFDFVMRDIIEWGRKVRFGGIISGHDYYMFHHRGVMTAVDAYVKAHNIKRVYYTDDKRHTYFWVKTKRIPIYRDEKNNKKN